MFSTIASPICFPALAGRVFSVILLDVTFYPSFIVAARQAWVGFPSPLYGLHLNAQMDNDVYDPVLKSINNNTCICSPALPPLSFSGFLLQVRLHGWHKELAIGEDVGQHFMPHIINLCVYIISSSTIKSPLSPWLLM